MLNYTVWGFHTEHCEPHLFKELLFLLSGVSSTYKGFYEVGVGSISCLYI